jgi:hypothetical protein
MTLAEKAAQMHASGAKRAKHLLMLMATFDLKKAKSLSSRAVALVKWAGPVTPVKQRRARSGRTHERHPEIFH